MKPFPPMQLLSHANRDAPHYQAPVSARCGAAAALVPR